MKISNLSLFPFHSVLWWNHALWSNITNDLKFPLTTVRCSLQPSIQWIQPKGCFMVSQIQIWFRHYSDVTMSVMASQITEWLFHGLFRLTSNKISRPAFIACLLREPPVTDGFNKGPVARKAFPCYDVIMGNSGRTNTQYIKMSFGSGLIKHDIYTSRPEQNSRYFADIFKCILAKERVGILIYISVNRCSYD